MAGDGRQRIRVRSRPAAPADCGGLEDLLVAQLAIRIRAA
jgi:hypothetical protein